MSSEIILLGLGLGPYYEVGRDHKFSGPTVTIKYLIRIKIFHGLGKGCDDSDPNHKLLYVNPF